MFRVSRCEILHRALLACVAEEAEADDGSRVPKGQRGQGRLPRGSTGSESNGEGGVGADRGGGDRDEGGLAALRRQRSGSVSYLGAAKDNEDALVVDKVTEKAPLVSGRPVLSARFNAETAGSERKTAENLNFGVSRNRFCDFLADPG